MDATPKIFEDVVLKGGTETGNCRLLRRLVSTITTNGKEFDLVTVDVEKHQELAAQYEVRSLPTVIAFKNGKKVDSFIGVIPPGLVHKFLMGV
ncbi:hypothetical protein OPQ81_007126 [Rhizoctonia solani]|nr:hypothetical protein OPQ81_007126 [Rhizoctonia solani]